MALALFCAPLTSAACGGTDEPGDTEVAAVASGVCRTLVGFDDLVAQRVNEASRQITTTTPTDEARTLLLDASERIGTAAGALPAQFQGLTDDEGGDSGRLIADVSSAAADVQAHLGDIEAELRDGHDGDGARQILSAVFIDMEKVQSLAQPDQGDYDDPALVAALETDPDCRHTVSR